MSDSWRKLKLGDRVRIVRIPSDFSLPGYYVDAETVALYEHLISEGSILTIDEIDDRGLPRIEFCWKKHNGDEFHGLALNDDSWELV